MLNYSPAFLVLNVYLSSSETSSSLKPSQQLSVLNRQFWSGVSAHLRPALHHEGGHPLSQNFSFNGKKAAWKGFYHWEGESIASSSRRKRCSFAYLFFQKEVEIVGNDDCSQLDGKWIVSGKYTYIFWASVEKKSLERQVFTSKTTGASELTHKHTEIILPVSLSQLFCTFLMPSYQ